MHWAMYSISCCGMPELLMSFFRRAKLKNFPPVQYVIFKIQVWVCEWVWVDSRPPFKVLIIQITGALCPFRPAIKFTNKMQTPVKSVCIEVILLRCYYIIDPKCCQGNWEHRKIGTKCAAIATAFSAKKDVVMILYHPLQKRVSILLHCNDFAPKKHCSTTIFSAILSR